MAYIELPLNKFPQPKKDVPDGAIYGTICKFFDNTMDMVFKLNGGKSLDIKKLMRLLNVDESQSQSRTVAAKYDLMKDLNINVSDLNARLKSHSNEIDCEKYLKSSLEFVNNIKKWLRGITLSSDQALAEFGMFYNGKDGLIDQLIDAAIPFYKLISEPFDIENLLNIVTIGFKLIWTIIMCILWFFIGKEMPKIIDPIYEGCRDFFKEIVLKKMEIASYTNAICLKECSQGLGPKDAKKYEEYTKQLSTLKPDNPKYKEIRAKLDSMDTVIQGCSIIRKLGGGQCPLKSMNFDILYNTLTNVTKVVEEPIELINNLLSDLTTTLRSIGFDLEKWMNRHYTPWPTLGTVEQAIYQKLNIIKSKSDPWDPQKMYKMNSLVSYKSTFYRSVSDNNIGHAPGSTDNKDIGYWVVQGDLTFGAYEDEKGNIITPLEAINMGINPDILTDSSVEEQPEMYMEEEFPEQEELV